MSRSLVEATKKFIEASKWLTDEDLPAIVMLEGIAEDIEGGDRSPAMRGQYGLAYRNLLKRAPSASDEVDPLDAALLEAADG